MFSKGFLENVAMEQLLMLWRMSSSERTLIGQQEKSKKKIIGLLKGTHLFICPLKYFTFEEKINEFFNWNSSLFPYASFGWPGPKNSTYSSDFNSSHSWNLWHFKELLMQMALNYCWSSDGFSYFKGKFLKRNKLWFLIISIKTNQLEVKIHNLEIIALRSLESIIHQ